MGGSGLDCLILRQLRVYCVFGFSEFVGFLGWVGFDFGRFWVVVICGVWWFVVWF